MTAYNINWEDAYDAWKQSGLPRRKFQYSDQFISFIGDGEIPSEDTVRTPFRSIRDQRGDWRFDVNGFAIVPHVGLRGIYMMNDEFTTTIDGKDAFKNDQENTFTMQIPVGISVERAFGSASGWNVVPTADVTIAPQFGDTEYDTTVTGIGTGVSQVVTADMAGNVLGRVAFGVKAENGASSFGAHYGFTVGDAGRRDHAFNFSFCYRF